MNKMKQKEKRNMLLIYILDRYYKGDATKSADNPCGTETTGVDDILKKFPTTFPSSSKKEIEHILKSLVVSGDIKAIKWKHGYYKPTPQAVTTVEE